MTSQSIIQLCHRRIVVARCVATLLLVALLSFFARPGLADECPPTRELFRLTDFDGFRDDQLGVALDIDRDLLAAGALGVNSLAGAVYVFDLMTGEQLHHLMASDAEPLDFNGSTVSISNGLLISGAYGKDSYTGAAYVFDAITGDEMFKLRPSDSDPQDYFGVSVAIDGNLALVGASENNSGNGASYLFDASTGEELRKLTATDGELKDYFGRSVALSGDLAIVGAPGDESLTGAVYVFDVTTGDQIHKLTASDGIEGDEFGLALDLDGNIAVVGVWRQANKTGAAYVYDVTTGQELFKLTASDGRADDKFGGSVALSDDLVLATASGREAGVVYFYDITGGEQVAKLMPPAGVGFLGHGTIDNGHTVIRVFDPQLNLYVAYVFAPGATLNVTPMPLIAKEPAIFTACGFEPNQRAWLAYSFDGLGETYIPQLDVTLSLVNPKAAVTGIIDANGRAEWDTTVPELNTIADIWFQTAQRENVSNYVKTQIRP